MNWKKWGSALLAGLVAAVILVTAMNVDTSDLDADAEAAQAMEPGP